MQPLAGLSLGRRRGLARRSCRLGRRRRGVRRRLLCGRVSGRSLLGGRPGLHRGRGLDAFDALALLAAASRLLGLACRLDLGALLFQLLDQDVGNRHGLGMSVGLLLQEGQQAGIAAQGSLVSVLDPADKSQAERGYAEQDQPEYLLESEDDFNLVCGFGPRSPSHAQL